jgi:hypothetical protein
VDPGLANARYVSVGACFIILLCITVTPVVFAVHEAMSEGLRWQLSRGSIAQTVDWPFWIQAAFFALCLLFVFAVCLPVRLILLGAYTGTGADALRYGENASRYWSLLWRLLPDWFWPLIACGAFVGEVLALRTVMELSNAKYKTEKGVIIVPGQLKTQRPDVTAIANKVLLLINIALAPVIFFYLLIAVHTYATKIYPVIKSSFGGGDFGYVRFVFEKDKVPQIPGLLPMSQGSISRSVRLLSDAGAGYAFLGSDEKREYAGIVDKSLVRGLLAAEKETSAKGLPGDAAHEK